MKITCSLSGLDYSVDYFPSRLSAGFTYHPIFDLPQSRLHEYYSMFCRQQLKQEEVFLLTLALLKSSELIVFRHCAQFSPVSTGNCYRNLERLYRIVSLIQSILVPHVSFPRISINQETAELENLSDWLKVWEDSYSEFMQGLVDNHAADLLKRKERALEKFIKSPNIPARKYAHVLAEWAVYAFNFPDYIVDYWQEVIIKCYNYDQIVSIPLVDMEELIEHCESELGDSTIGTIQSNLLFSVLSEGKQKIQSEQIFAKNKEGIVILDDTRKDHAHIIEVIKTAPVNQPNIADYPSKFDYQKALMRWQMAKLINSENIQTGDI